MRAAIHQVVTFAADAFAGNPAYALECPERLDPVVASRVCDQLQAGVLAVLGPGDERRPLAFYTAHGPHDGAGHAGHAAAHVALANTDRVTFDLPGGNTLEAQRIDGRIAVRWPAMAFAPSERSGALAAALQRSVREALASSFGYVAVLAAAADLEGLHPDMAAIRELDRGALVVTAPGETSDFVVRVFAPRLGLPEDPVCGTAHRFLAPYWRNRLGRTMLHSRQMSPRGGDLWCTVEPASVTIAGGSRPFLDGWIDLP